MKIKSADRLTPAKERELTKKFYDLMIKDGSAHPMALELAAREERLTCLK